jgi:predicted dehydrogenase
MREIIGMPKACLGAALQPPGIWTALFQYDGFPVTYESGVNQIPIFDACIEIFSRDKSVRVQYDSPYVKGLPTTLIIREKVEGVTGSNSSGFQERVVRRTYEDNYTIEFGAFYDCVVSGTAPKTTITDARNDVDLFAMIMKAGKSSFEA